MANEIVAAETAARRDLILDQLHTLVQVISAESEGLILPRRWLVLRAQSVSGSAPVSSAGEAPELWFELEGSRLEAQLKESAGWQEPKGAAEALYQLAADNESWSPRHTGDEASWGLDFGSDEVRGELALGSAKRRSGHRAGRG